MTTDIIKQKVLIPKICTEISSVFLNKSHSLHSYFIILVFIFVEYLMKDTKMEELAWAKRVCHGVKHQFLIQAITLYTSLQPFQSI
jgi:hypothetical protein